MFLIGRRRGYSQFQLFQPLNFFKIVFHMNFIHVSEHIFSFNCSYILSFNFYIDIFYEFNVCEQIIFLGFFFIKFGIDDIVES